jgi:hypothetical protein
MGEVVLGVRDLSFVGLDLPEDLGAPQLQCLDDKGKSPIRRRNDDPTGSTGSVNKLKHTPHFQANSRQSAVYSPWFEILRRCATEPKHCTLADTDARANC